MRSVSLSLITAWYKPMLTLFRVSMVSDSWHYYHYCYIGDDDDKDYNNYADNAMTMNFEGGLFLSGQMYVQENRFDVATNWISDVNDWYEKLG
jgi:hypothetical protein